MTDNDAGILDTPEMITRREAVLRVKRAARGIALIWRQRPHHRLPRREGVAGGSAVHADDIAYLDEIADTILPTTSTLGRRQRSRRSSWRSW
jgi:hypothetical protein